MTDTRRPEGGASGPPWSLDVLADLHAGVLTEAEAARLWPRVESDPGAMAVIAALDATRTDLAALADAPVAPLPPEVAARIDAALAAERASAQMPGAHVAATPPDFGQPGHPRPAAPGEPVADLAAARRRRHRLLGWAAGLTAAAAVAAAVALSLPSETTTGTPIAEPSTGPTGAPPALANGELGSALGGSLGVRDYGPLGDRARLDACRKAAGLDVDVQPVGIRPVTLDGSPAVLVVLTTGQLARYRIVVFATDCGPGNPGVLADRTVGGTTR